MKKLQIKKGNYGFFFSFTILESDQPKDLTGLTPVLKVWKGSTLKFSRICTVQDVGVVLCQIQEGDFDEEGILYGEIELQGTDYVEDTETFVIEVLPSP